jgi:antitoxin MazE
MKTRVQKWGNSLALRIPKSFADDAGLQADAPVKLSLAKGKLIIEPLPPETLSLQQLLEAVTAENLHGEWNTGKAAGREAW